MTSESTQEHRQNAPKALRFSVLTISDTRTLATDKSGQLIASQMQEAGHELVSHDIVKDEPVEIRQRVVDMTSASHQPASIDVVITTGGTGISPRDQTPEAIEPLFDVRLPGFGEMFRVLSYEEIGAATMLSRATAGRVGSVLVFCLPGSSNAVRLAMEKLLVPELPHLVHHSKA